MSFDFTIDNDADQVVNCAVIEIEEQPCANCTQAPTPTEQPTPDAGGNNGEIPDYCVILDVPDYTETIGDPVISDLDPDITSITKTCEAPVAGMHNGQLGMLWNCQINVTTDTTPFAGSLIVSDFQNLTSGNFGNTQNQITSISSVSGNFDCSQGQSCTVSGADFDSNGEAIDVVLFVTSDELNTDIDNTDFQLQNCAQGYYTTSAGVNQTIAGNCVNAPWPPMLSHVAKTCDPIEPVTSGPMTLNCQITVTGSNLPTDGYLFIADG